MVKRWIENQLKDIIDLKKICYWKNISIGIHLEFFKKHNNYKNKITEQINIFSELFWFKPNHIDIHKDLPDFEYDIKLTKKVISISNNMKIPFRNRKNTFLAQKHTNWQMFLISQKKWKDILLRINSLEENKSYELVSHPGKFDPEIKSNLNSERKNDIKIIKKINLLKEKLWIELISFKNL